MAFNVMISAYLYSTERSVPAIIINVLRSLVVSPVIIFALPELFGASIVWHTFGIYEVVVLLFAVLILKRVERKGLGF